MEFTQRHRPFIRGLSPLGLHGGYCIFVTLDKASLDHVASAQRSVEFELDKPEDAGRYFEAR